MVFQLVYASSAANGMTDNDRKNVAAICQSKNLQDDISGVLFWYDGSILQILEGEEVPVRNLYHRIQNDERNKGCYILHSHHAKQREFKDWSMGFQTRPNRSNKDFVFTLTPKSFGSVVFGIQDQVLASLTRTYGRVSGL